MSTENTSLMQAARQSLDGNWGLGIGTFLVYGLAASIGNSIAGIGTLASLIIGGPLALGGAMFSLAMARGQEVKLEMIFKGFSRFGPTLVAYLLSALYTFLWSLLFIVPGIIAALSYSMIFYIMADDEQISGEDALKKSKAMMDGYKAKLFRLHLRFVLWGIACLFTLGIGFLWLVPYIHITMAKFYEDIKGGAAGNAYPKPFE